MKNPIVTIEVEKFGTIKAELRPDVAKNTVTNFVSLASKGFYDGVIFHRIISGFMLQGGDPTGSGMGGPGYSIKGEFKTNGVENNLKHQFGVLSMARSQSKNSGGSQFFIMLGDSPHLDGDYASFGTVIEGDDVVKAIGIVATKQQDRPVEDVVIKKMTVETFGEVYGEPEKC